MHTWWCLIFADPILIKCGSTSLLISLHYLFEDGQFRIYFLVKKMNAYLLIKMKWIYHVYTTSEWIHGDIYSPKTYARNLGAHESGA